MIIWIREAMLKRTVAMRLGTWASDACTITPGLPQGSALSTVLFNVYTVGITSNQFSISRNTWWIPLNPSIKV